MFLEKKNHKLRTQEKKNRYTYNKENQAREQHTKNALVQKIFLNLQKKGKL